MSAGAIAIAALVMAGVGTGLSAYSSYQEGKAAKREAEYNAALSDQEAAARIAQGKEEEKLHREDLKRLMARQYVLYAKAGVDPTSDSPLLVAAYTMKEGEKEAIKIRQQAKYDAGMLRARGGITRYAGSQAYSAGMVRSGSTLLSGLGSATMGYAGAKNTGLIK
jgi:hypothetical protein